MQPTRLRRSVTALSLAAAVLSGGLAGLGPARADEVPPAPAVTPAPLRILPLGDSLTWGVGSTDDAGYRGRLYAALTAAGVRADFTGSRANGTGADRDHEGHPGWRIDQIDAHLGPWLRAAAPDVVLLDIGTNDSVQNFAVAQAPLRLARLVDRIHVLAPRAHVVLAELLVIAGDRRAAQIRGLNVAIGRIAAERRAYVTPVDMSRIPVANTVDGVHPTDAGYRQMAFQWYQALRRVLPGGAAWPVVADPFPIPAVRVAVHRAGVTRVTAQLSGRLTAADLAGVPVRLTYRRAGTETWTSLGTARTGRDGVARFSHRLKPGALRVTVVAGRAAGRISAAARV